MKRITRKLLALLPLYIAVSAPWSPAPEERAFAVEIHPNAGTTSAAFLKLGIGSRAVAMGGAFAGLADDATALYWNPAGLAQLQRQELHVTHNESFESIRHDYIGLATPFRGGTMAGAVYGLYTPKDLERRSGLNENDPYEPLSPVEGYFQAYDIAAQLSYGRRLNGNLAGGASFKVIQQRIDDKSAFAAAVDLGILCRFDSLPLTCGAVVQHLGTPVKFIERSYPLPVNFRLGAAWRWNRRLVSTLDINKPIDNFLLMAAGTEYQAFDFLALRAGYRYRWYGLELGDLSGLSAGIGINFAVRELHCRLDYAFLPFGVLGNSHRMSITTFFAGRTAAPASRPAHDIPPAGAAVNTTVIPLPREPALSDDHSTEYRYYRATVSIHRRIASGRAALYQVKGKCGGGDVSDFEGNAVASVRALSISVGEKPGNGSIYKYYVFSRNPDIRLARGRCTLRLPRQLQPFAVVADDGGELRTQKLGEDGDYSIYRFDMETIGDFRVELR